MYPTFIILLCEIRSRLGLNNPNGGDDETITTIAFDNRPGQARRAMPRPSFVQSLSASLHIGRITTRSRHESRVRHECETRLRDNGSLLGSGQSSPSQPGSPTREQGDKEKGRTSMDMAVVTSV